MARKKNTESTQVKQQTMAERMQAIDNLCATLTKNGTVIAGRINKSPEVKERMTFHYYPTKIPELNEKLGGGLPVGRTVLISGNPDSGKTAFCMDCISENQQRDPNFFALWVESEDSLDLEKAASLFHVDLERLPAIGISQKNAKEFGAEAIGNAIEDAIRQSSPNMVVINSLKMLIPMAELSKGLESDTVAVQARFNSKLMKKLTSLCAEHNTTLILIQHYTTQIGGFSMHGTPKDIAGGLAIRYGNMVTLEFSNPSLQDGDPVTYETGKAIQVRITKNHCVIDRFPYAKVKYFIEYGKGIERIYSTLNRLIDQGIITKAGAWLYMLDKNGEKDPDMSWQGKAKFKADMEANPTKFDTLCSLLDLPQQVGETEELTDEEIEELKKQESMEAEADKAMDEALKEEE